MAKNSTQRKCPKCGGKLRQKLQITIDCPTGQTALDKAAIRKAGVIVEAVMWDFPTVYCTRCSFMYRNAPNKA